MKNREEIKKQSEKIIEVQDLRQQKYFDWLKNILTIATAFLGIDQLSAIF